MISCIYLSVYIIYSQDSWVVRDLLSKGKVYFNYLLVESIEENFGGEFFIDEMLSETLESEIAYRELY